MSIATVDLKTSEKTTKEFLKGNVAAPLAPYNPDQKTKDRIAEVMRKFRFSYQLMHKPLVELNDDSVITAIDKYQKLFNNYRTPKSNDPDDDWRSNAVRPIVRNRAISVAAHVLAALVKPQVFAQNDQSEEDKDAETVMRDLMDWANEQSGYERTFLYAVIAALVNPISIIHTEYADITRTVKEIQDNGKWKETVVKDKTMSGFRDLIVAPDELFIADLYEPDVQKQPYLFWRRVIDYGTAYGKYKDNPNFVNYVHPGLLVMYDPITQHFYHVYDETLRTRLVEEFVYYDRNQDLQLTFVNGVCMDDPDQPNPRIDKKYPFVCGGYELIGQGRSFYYFPLVRKMMDDAEVLNTLYRAFIDGSLLKAMPPTAWFGSQTFSTDVMTPGSVTTFSDPNVKLQQIDVGHDLNAGLGAIHKLEESIAESSNDVFGSGALPGGRPTAFQMSLLSQEATILFGLFTHMIGFMVKQYGELRASDILQFLTVAEVEELGGDDTKMQYRKFLLPERNSNGKTKTRKIDFMNETPEDPMKESYNILDQEGGLNGDKEIFRVNASLFRELDFKIVIRPDTQGPLSDGMKKTLNLEEFDRLINLPFIDQEAVTKDLLLGSYDATKGDVSKYIKKQVPMPPQQGVMPGAPGAPGAPSAPGAPQAANPMAKIFGNGQNRQVNQNAGLTQAEQIAR